MDQEPHVIPLPLNSPEWWDVHASRWKKRGLDRDRPKEYVTVVHRIKRGPILEVGPGFASLCKHLPRRIDYVGMDLSRGMIQACRQRFPYRLFIQENFLRINEFAYEKAFEHVVALQTLEHFSRAAFGMAMLLIQKICRVSLLFSVPRGEPTEAITAADGHLIGWEDEKAVRADFERYGQLKFIYAERNHIAGELTYE